MTKQSKFIVAIIIQLVIIFSIIIFKVSILSGGQDVVLRIAPVDPRDPLRGDYVTFTYEDISSVNSYYFKYNNIRNGDKVYVALREYGGFYYVENINKIKPVEGTFIKGTVVSDGGDIFSDNDNSLLSQSINDGEIEIKYGIEEYFIKEGSGRNMRFAEDKNYALIKVDSDGNAVIKQLYIDGNPWP